MQRGVSFCNTALLRGDACTALSLLLLWQLGAADLAGVNTAEDAMRRAGVVSPGVPLRSLLTGSGFGECMTSHKLSAAFSLVLISAVALMDAYTIAHRLSSLIRGPPSSNRALVGMRNSIYILVF